MSPDKPATQSAGRFTASGGLAGAKWRKASRSGAENGGCVEIAGEFPGVTAIRDSRRPHGGIHLIPKAAFAAFLAAAKAGSYDMESAITPAVNTLGDLQTGDLIGMRTAAWDTGDTGRAESIDAELNRRLRAVLHVMPRPASEPPSSPLTP